MAMKYRKMLPQFFYKFYYYFPNLFLSFFIFKKLALSLHPDKNRDDPDADSKFMEISNIYEILKEDDTRKRYDLFGEAGLKKSRQNSRQNYEDVMKTFTA